MRTSRVATRRPAGTRTTRVTVGRIAVGAKTAPGRLGEVAARPMASRPAGSDAAVRTFSQPRAEAATASHATAKAALPTTRCWSRDRRAATPSVSQCGSRRSIGKRMPKPPGDPGSLRGHCAPGEGPDRKGPEGPRRPFWRVEPGHGAGSGTFAVQALTDDGGGDGGQRAPATSLIAGMIELPYASS